MLFLGVLGAGYVLGVSSKGQPQSPAGETQEEKKQEPEKEKPKKETKGQGLRGAAREAGRICC